MAAINNDWYIYENDIYGVNALLEFGSKEELMEYVVDEEFVDNRMPDGISEEGKKKIEKLTTQFRAKELDNKQYASALETLITEEKGEIESMHVDNFESLCQGTTYLGKFAVEVFAERQGQEDLKAVPEELKPAFKEFIDNALGDWVG